MQQNAVRTKVLASAGGSLGTAVLAYTPAVLVALVFACDAWHPADIVFSALYVVPIVLTLALGTPRATYFVFVVTSVATVAIAGFGAPPTDATAALANRVLALMAQGLAAVVVIQQLQIRERDRARLRTQETVAVRARAAVAMAEAGLCSLQEMLRSLPEAVFTLDINGRIVEINPGAAKLLGSAIHLYAGRPWSDLASGLNVHLVAGRPQSAEPIPAGWPLGGPYTLAGEMIMQLGEDTCEVHCMFTAAKLIRQDVVAGGLIIFRDVTMLRDRERQKDEFVSMATHELKSPISTIRGYAQLSQTNADRMNPAEVVANAEKIVRQADRLSHLVNDLLDVSRIHAGRMSLRVAPVQTGDLVRDAVDYQRAVHPERCFILDYRGCATVILGDAERLEQVLTNLLDNAVKYSPDGGPVTVTVESTTTEVAVTVTDSGVGIPYDEQGQLFQRFYRGRARAHRFSGLGVGLYISHTIVREHGGQMWVRSSESGGSTFGFVLPVTPPLNREPDLIA